MPDFIKLPSERVEQLRILSESRTMSIADLIGEFVRDQITKGNLADAIPGIEVVRRGDEVEIACPEFKRVFSLELARAFATFLYLYSQPKTAHSEQGLGTLSESIRELTLSLSGAEQHLGLSRRGTSVKIAGEDGAARTLAPSIARELAALVSVAAK